MPKFCHGNKGSPSPESRFASLLLPRPFPPSKKRTTDQAFAQSRCVAAWLALQLTHICRSGGHRFADEDMLKRRISRRKPAVTRSGACPGPWGGHRFSDKDYAHTERLGRS